MTTESAPGRTDTVHADAFAAIAGNLPTGCYIGGEWRSSSDGSLIAVADPSTGETLTSVARGVRDGPALAVAAPGAALPAWSATPPRARSEVLRRAFEIMTERHE